jgi:hypothetical protein
VQTPARVSWVSHVHGPYLYPVIRRGRSKRSSLEGCGTPPRVNRLDYRARGSGDLAESSRVAHLLRGPAWLRCVPFQRSHGLGKPLEAILVALRRACQAIGALLHPRGLAISRHRGPSLRRHLASTSMPGKFWSGQISKWASAGALCRIRDKYLAPPFTPSYATNVQCVLYTYSALAHRRNRRGSVGAARTIRPICSYDLFDRVRSYAPTIDMPAAHMAPS